MFGVVVCSVCVGLFVLVFLFVGVWFVSGFSLCFV